MMEDGISQSVGLIIEQQAKALKEYIQLCNQYKDCISEMESVVKANIEYVEEVREELENCKEHNEELVKQLSKCRCKKC